MQVVLTPASAPPCTMPASMPGSVIPTLAWPSVRRTTRFTPSTIPCRASSSPLSHPPDRLVLPPVRMRMIRSATELSPAGAGPLTTVTSSSKATTASRSLVPRKPANRRAASSAAASGAPDMDPDRSSTSTALIGGRWAGASPERVVRMPTWWAFWVVKNLVDRWTCARMTPPCALAPRNGG